jgi:FKBP-type peptidyl-prolyl cis-trans isomerase FklB
MKKILFFLFLVFALTSCDERFMSWKDYNDMWLESQRGKLGDDINVVETEILPSGILIEKYHNGYGAIPKPTVDPVTQVSSAVVVKYTGWLVDGTQFDHSEKSSFFLSQVIEGWQAVMSIMPQGSYWRVYIPSDKAYGEAGSRGLYENFSVPPHSTLVFDIELIDVVNY